MSSRTCVQIVKRFTGMCCPFESRHSVYTGPHLRGEGPSLGVVHREAGEEGGV